MPLVEEAAALGGKFPARNHPQLGLAHHHDPYSQRPRLLFQLDRLRAVNVFVVEIWQVMESYGIYNL